MADKKKLENMVKDIPAKYMQVMDKRTGKVSLAKEGYAKRLLKDNTHHILKYYKNGSK